MRSLLLASLLFAMICTALATPLPERDGEVMIPTQPVEGGDAREIKLYLRYPGQQKSNITATTGILLSLHNWGGTAFSGAPDPARLTGELDCVVIGVDYYQSGNEDLDRPYDFGWIQALDALRALHYLLSNLEEGKLPYAKERLSIVGGSGGGQVALMANKLAPRTFATVVDLSGMKELNDEIAFDHPGGSSLNARYSSDPASPHFLTADAREIRWLGNPRHLEQMKALGATARVISIHGVDDQECPFADAERFATAYQASGLPFAFHPITTEEVDGDLITDTGHGLGDRTALLLHYAGEALRTAATNPNLPNDFQQREIITYPTANGLWCIDYSRGAPVGQFLPHKSD